MLWEQPGFWILAAYAALTTLMSRRITEGVKTAERHLSAPDIETFRREYRKKSARAAMPSKFSQLAEATDRASRFWLINVGVIVVLLTAYVYLGPSMGLAQ